MLNFFCEDPFWNWTLVWNSKTPQFTSCFEDVVFISLPCIIFSMAFLISLCCHPKYSSQHFLPWTWLNITKMVLSLTLLCVSGICCGVVYFEKISQRSVHSVILLSSSAKFVTFGFVTALMFQYRRSGVTTSTLLSIFWFFFSFTSILLLRSDIYRFPIFVQKSTSLTIFICNMIYHIVIFLQFLLSFLLDRKRFSFLQDNKIMDKVPFFSSVTFVWFNRIIHRSRKKLLEVSDLRFFHKKFTASFTFTLFSNNWNFEKITEAAKSQSLAWALIKSFWSLIVAGIILDLLFVFILMLPPLLLDRIIDFVNDDIYTWQGYLFTGLLFIVDVFGKAIQNNCVNCLICSGGQLTSALMGAIFRKNLSLSTDTRKDYASGALLNLFSVDVKRIEYFSFQCSSLISAPIKIVVIMYIMWQYIGPSTLAGVLVMILLFPVSFYMARLSEKYSENQMKMKDVRLKLMNEVLNGIKILKLYAWENPFSSKVCKARKEEMKFVRYSQLCYVGTAFVFYCAPIMVSIASFATYLLLNSSHVLDPTRAFVCLTLMDQLRYALFELPDSVSELIQCNISMGRIRRFFITENKDKSIVGNNPDSGEGISVRNAFFSWCKEGTNVLSNINLNLPCGILVAITGPVGAGKSSLLSSFLGETYKQKGTINILDSVAYVPQQAWILNQTVKHNVLFVKHMVKEKYDLILDKCCLRTDLDVLPSGDETEIGEKGVNLSGGQKQRVSLARAVYQNKDIYLFDDPLSAVDVHVGKSLFNDVIGNNGLLKKKTRVLVTHDISILPKVDLIVCMKEGRIEEIGTYEDLLKNEGPFKNFIEEYCYTNAEDSSTEHIRSFDRLKSTDSTISRLSGGDHPTIVEDETNDLETAHRLIEDERMESGGVSYRVYLNYIKKMSYSLFFWGVFGFMAFISFEAGSNIWLSKWSTQAIRNDTENATSIYYISIYGSLGFAQVFFVVLGSVLLVLGSTKASETYYFKMLESVLKSPMSFFDSTPMGRIMNRFSTDMDILDIQVYYTMDGWLTCMFSIISAFVIIGINTPIFFAFLLPLGIIYYILQALHLNAFRQIHRLESTTRSPIYSHFLESIQGVSSICAYKVEKDFIQSFEEKVDRNIMCSLNTAFCNRWLAFWLNLLGSVVILLAALLAVHNRVSLGPSIVALMITYALSVTDALKWFVRMNTEMENKSIAIERIDEYSCLKSERPWNLELDESYQKWPSDGNIIFENYCAKYKEDLDLVLKKINVSITSNEKVGIIGRTGAGKSSITMALFRIIEASSGKIKIDDVDISALGLHKVRSGLTIIPQDPVLFTGSLRSNLDPNDQYADDCIWESLEKSHLKDFVCSLSEGLEYTIEEGGANLSAGQRQLICLTRALLRNSKVLVLDEATASVDMDTDSLIQATIRTAFADKTVITIAHRLNTIADYDKVIVMDCGTIVEVGKPSNLLQDINSNYYKMNLEAGLI